MFDVHNLDLAKVAKSFGLAAPPRVDLNLSTKARSASKTRLKARVGKDKLAYQHKSMRGSRDGRQFSR